MISDMLAAFGIIVVLLTSEVAPMAAPVATNCATTEAVPVPNYGIGKCASDVFPHNSVLVTVNPDGSVASAILVRSSGTGSLDALAIKEARLSKYRAKMVNCKPVRGTYLRIRYFATECG